ncbi:hypothetical protein PENTCL1PPCAC_22552, partial [Pristionchus entomophagus]
MERYDRAITIFSPDGHLFQVEYAQEAVKKGSTAVGVRGKNCIVIGVEKKAIPALQDERTIRKIHMIDDHVMLAFAGLSADARILVDKARLECQSYKLTLEDPVTIAYIARFIANTKQRFTQSPGRRPFGISMLIGGFDHDGTPRLFKTEPSGAYYEYLANSTGRGEKTVREYLEEQFSEDSVKDEASSLLLVIKALSQVVQSGAQNIEIAVMTKGDTAGEFKHRVLSLEEVEQLLKKVEEERLAAEAEEAAKKERKWDPPSDPLILVRGYAISYGIGSPSYKLIIEGEHATTFTINGLKPNTSYVFAVNAYNEADGEDGERVVVSSNTHSLRGEEREVLWAPVAVHSKATSHGIDVEWEDPNENRVANHIHYLISYGIYQSEKMSTIRSNSRSVRITNVLPDREYEIAVKAVDEEGRESVWSIRDIVLTPRVEKNISQYDWTCDFEKDICDIQSTEDGIEWRRERKGRVTPIHGKWSLIADSLHGKGTRLARLLTPIFNMAKSVHLCVSINIMSSDRAKGTVVLSVMDEKTSNLQQIARIEVHQLRSGKWGRLRLPIRRQAHPFRVVVEFSWPHDGVWLAVDNVELSSGGCTQDNTTIRIPHL